MITFYNHEVVGKKIAKHIGERLRLSNKDKEKLTRLVGMHQFSVSETLTDKAVRRFIREIGKEYIDDILAVRVGDRIGSGAKPSSWRFELFKKRIIEVQHEPFKVTDLHVNGNDVMQELDIPPGPHIGSVFQKLFEEVDEGILPNEREALLERMRLMKNDTVYS